MSDNTPQDPKKPFSAPSSPEPVDPTGPDLSEVMSNPPEPEPAPVPAGKKRMSVLEEISLDAALSDEARKMGPVRAQKNVKQILYGGIGVVLLIVLLMVYSCQPRNGSMAYGICSTFLELNTPYPETLRFTDLEGSNTAVRIYFTNIDPFGEFRQEMIECTFGADEKMGMKLTEVKRNRRAVDPALVKKFNITLPTIMASDPYLVLPPDWKNPLVPDYYNNDDINLYKD